MIRALAKRSNAVATYRGNSVVNEEQKKNKKPSVGRQLLAGVWKAIFVVCLLIGYFLFGNYARTDAVERPFSAIENAQIAEASVQEGQKITTLFKSEAEIQAAITAKVGDPVYSRLRCTQSSILVAPYWWIRWQFT